MLFIVTIQPANVGPGGNFNISHQIDASDMIEALEAAKELVRKSAESQARALLAALPAPAQGEASPTV